MSLQCEITLRRISWCCCCLIAWLSVDTVSCVLTTYIGWASRRVAVCLWVCLSVCLWVCLCVCVSVSVSVCLSVWCSVICRHAVPSLHECSVTSVICSTFMRLKTVLVKRCRPTVHRLHSTLAHETSSDLTVIAVRVSRYLLPSLIHSSDQLLLMVNCLTDVTCQSVH